MKNSILKSIGAILAGFIVGIVLSIGPDLLLDKVGFMKMEPFKENAAWVVGIVIMYRFIYNVIGCYVAASLAPNRPMGHALIMGVIGLTFGILGSIAMWDKAAGWYNISIILIALPSAWIGGKLKIENFYRN
jgi:hypothetical protein